MLAPSDTEDVSRRHWQQGTRRCGRRPDAFCHISPASPALPLTRLANGVGFRPGSTDGPGRVALGRVILIVGAVGMLLLLVCPAFPVGVSVGPFGGWIKLARIAAGCIRWCCATT
jgi:hypothetical protein